jgi:hypothetical protein
MKNKYGKHPVSTDIVVHMVSPSSLQILENKRSFTFIIYEKKVSLKEQFSL